MAIPAVISSPATTFLMLILFTLLSCSALSVRLISTFILCYNSVTVTPYEREGSNIKGLARIYFENSFIVNNINIVQGKEKIFVSMPSYKTKQVDEQGKPIYQDVCYPVTKDFREKLYNEIISEYEKAKDKSNENARESAEKHHGNPDKEKDKEATPFR